jgi:hypothetical protein
MGYQEYKDRLLEFTQKQDLEWEIYLHAFRVKNPEPVIEQPERKTAKLQPTEVSVKFWLALFTACAAVGVSGMRVFDRFYQTSFVTSQNSTFATFEALFGVIAVNVGIIALSFAVAYTKRKMSENSMLFALVTAVTISLVAGLGQGFAGLKLNTVLTYFDWVLAVVLAAVTAIEYFSGDMLGVEWWSYKHEQFTNRTNYENEQRTLNEQYELELRTNEQKYEHEHKEWLRTAKSQFGLWKANYEQWHKANYRTERTNSEQDNEPRPVRTNKPRTESTNSSFVRDILEQHYEQTNELMSFSELMRTITNKANMTNEQAAEFANSKKGYISEIRSKWAKERGLK